MRRAASPPQVRVFASRGVGFAWARVAISRTAAVTATLVGGFLVVQGWGPTRPCGSQGHVLQWQTRQGLEPCQVHCERWYSWMRGDAFGHRFLAATTEPALVRPTWPWMDGRGVAMRQEGRGLAHCLQRGGAACCRKGPPVLQARRPKCSRSRTRGRT